MLANAPGATTEARLFSLWYLAHINNGSNGTLLGTINVYWYRLDGTPSTTQPTTCPDSQDSYASMFLYMSGIYEQKTGDLSIFKNNRTKFEQIARVIAALYNPADHLVATTQFNPQENLADNAENYAGEVAMARLGSLIRNGKPARYAKYANDIAKGIGSLWNSAAGYFYLYKDPTTGVLAAPDWSNWDTAVIEAWPTIYALPKPHTSVVYNALDMYFSWQQNVVDPTGYSWPIAGVEAYLGSQQHGNPSAAMELQDAKPHAAWLMNYEFTAGGTKNGNLFTIADAGDEAYLVVKLDM